MVTILPRKMRVLRNKSIMFKYIQIHFLAPFTNTITINSREVLYRIEVYIYKELSNKF